MHCEGAAEDLSPPADFSQVPMGVCVHHSILPPGEGRGVQLMVLWDGRTQILRKNVGRVWVILLPTLTPFFFLFL